MMKIIFFTSIISMSFRKIKTFFQTFPMNKMNKNIKTSAFMVFKNHNQVSAYSTALQKGILSPL